MIKPKNSLKDIVCYKTDEYRLDIKYKLDSNENIYGCQDYVFNILKNLNKEEISLYPCYGKLLDKLAQKYSTKDILLTNGCDEALSVIINAYLDENDEILSYSPSFSMPHLYAKAVGAKTRTIEYSEKYVFDKNDFEKNISAATKIIYIAAPNNPTGEIAEACDINCLAQSHKDILFVVDCTYINFSCVACFEDYIELIKTNDNIAVVKSFSKDFALAGLRLGFVISNSGIISNLKKIASPYNVNSIAVNCALGVLDNEDAFGEVKQKINIAKQRLFEGLLELGYEPYESEANFILCDFKEHLDFVFEKLKKQGIITRKYAKNTNLETCLRITVPTIDAVDEILEILKPRPIFVFDMDGVIFDVSQSYRKAIIKTFEHFTGFSCSSDDIQMVKNAGGMSNDWKVTHYLISKAGKEVSYQEVIDVFQGLFFNPLAPMGQKGLIDCEKTVLDKDFFEKLSQNFDLAIFTSRDNIEAFYSLEKAGIKKYFSYFITAESVGEFVKPSGYGLNLIKQNCSNSEIYYFGDTIDDIKAGLEAGAKVFGVIPPNASKIDETIKSLKDSGAYGIIKNKNDILNLKKDKICL